MTGKLTGEKLENEMLRLEEMLTYERQYGWAADICGIDEAGRGPLAGPVVAGPLIWPPDSKILLFTESTPLSEKRREELFLEIQEKAVSFAVGIVEPKEIDRINILQATYAAMRQAVEKLSRTPQVLLNDAVEIPGLPAEMKQVKIIRGDAKSLSIAAASVLAKVTRDHLMMDYDLNYPQYGFAKHKGYGTAAHIQALKNEGPGPIHRKTFIGKFVKTEDRDEK